MAIELQEILDSADVTGQKMDLAYVPTAANDVQTKGNIDTAVDLKLDKDGATNLSITRPSPKITVSATSGQADIRIISAEHDIGYNFITVGSSDQFLLRQITGSGATLGNVLIVELNRKVEFLAAPRTRLAPINIDDLTRKDYVDAQVATKTDEAYVDAQVAPKADTTYVDAQVATKTDEAYVDAQVATKTDEAYVDAQVATKTDEAYVDAQVAPKADTTYVDGQLDQKVDLLGDQDISIIKNNPVLSIKNITNANAVHFRLLDGLLNTGAAMVLNIGAISLRRTDGVGTTTATIFSVPDGSNTVTFNQSPRSNITPVAADDLTRKDYVDTKKAETDFIRTGSRLDINNVGTA